MLEKCGSVGNELFKTLVFKCEVSESSLSNFLWSYPFEVIQIIFEWWGIYAHKVLTGTPQASSREILCIENAEVIVICVGTYSLPL